MIQKKFFFLNRLRVIPINPEQVSVYFLPTRAFSSITLLHNHDVATKIRKLMHDSHGILRPRASCASGPNNVLYGKRIGSRIAQCV